MGNVNSSENQKTHELGALQNAEQSNIEWQDVIESYECCFIEYKSNKKKKLIWQTQLVCNCKQLRQLYAWPDELVNILSLSKVQRIPYMKEMNELLLQNQRGSIPLGEDRETLMSPMEIDQFKTQLKKSVLISYGSVSANTGKSHNKKGRKNTRVISIIPSMTPINQPGNFPIEQKRERDLTKGIRGSTRIDNFRQTVIGIPRKSFSRSDIRESMISFVDDTLSSMIRTQKEISKENAFSLQIFMRFSMIIEKHFCLNTCPMTIIVKNFKEFIYKKFDINLMNGQVTQEYVLNLIQNIKQFIALLSQTIYDFYNLKRFQQDIFPNLLVTSDDNLSTLITTILFKDQRFYQLVMGVIKEYNKKREILFQRVLDQMAGKTPECFQIQAAYCLNISTLRKHMERQSVDSKLQNFDIDDLQSVVPDSQPYNESIQTLKNIKKSKSPVSKMKVIMSCSQNITKGISKFYNENNLDIKQWVLDADQILSIFCYIICGARIPHLHSHLFLLEHFSTDHQLISITGYYYSVLMCALEQVQNNYKSRKEAMELDST